MPRRIALIACSLALTLVVAGCGSDDDSSDDTGGTTTTAATDETTTTADEGSDESTPEETTTSEDTTDSTEAEETTTTSSAVAPGDGDPEFCEAYASFNEEFNDLPSETVEEIQTGAAQLEERLGDLVEVAPEDLTEDLQLLADGAADLNAQIGDAQTPEEAQQMIMDTFAGDDFTAAAERVDGYFEQGCPQSEDPQVEDGGAETPETVTPG